MHISLFLMIFIATTVKTSENTNTPCSSTFCFTNHVAKNRIFDFWIDSPTNVNNLVFYFVSDILTSLTDKCIPSYFKAIYKNLILKKTLLETSLLKNINGKIEARNIISNIQLTFEKKITLILEKLEKKVKNYEIEGKSRDDEFFKDMNYLLEKHLFFINECSNKCKNILNFEFSKNKEDIFDKKDFSEKMIGYIYLIRVMIDIYCRSMTILMHPNINDIRKLFVDLNNEEEVNYERLTEFEKVHYNCKKSFNSLKYLNVFITNMTNKYNCFVNENLHQISEILKINLIPLSSDLLVSAAKTILNEATLIKTKAELKNENICYYFSISESHQNLLKIQKTKELLIKLCKEEFDDIDLIRIKIFEFSTFATVLNNAEIVFESTINIKDLPYSDQLIYDGFYELSANPVNKKISNIEFKKFFDIFPLKKNFYTAIRKKNLKYIKGSTISKKHCVPLIHKDFVFSLYILNDFQTKMEFFIKINGVGWFLNDNKSELSNLQVNKFINCSSDDSTQNIKRFHDFQIYKIIYPSFIESVENKSFNQILGSTSNHELFAHSKTTKYMESACFNYDLFSIGTFKFREYFHHPKINLINEKNIILKNIMTMISKHKPKECLLFDVDGLFDNWFSLDLFSNIKHEYSNVFPFDYVSIWMYYITLKSINKHSYVLQKEKKDSLWPNEYKYEIDIKKQEEILFNLSLFHLNSMTGKIVWYRRFHYFTKEIREGYNDFFWSNSLPNGQEINIINNIKNELQKKYHVYFNYCYLKIIPDSKKNNLIGLHILSIHHSIINNESRLCVNDKLNRMFDLFKYYRYDLLPDDKPEYLFLKYFNRSNSLHKILYSYL